MMMATQQTIEELKALIQKLTERVEKLEKQVLDNESKNQIGYE